MDDDDSPGQQHTSSIKTMMHQAKERIRSGKDSKEEKAILELKLHLDKLQRERQYKNAALAARNALLIERDEAARDEYRKNHKTDEELYQEWLEELAKQQAAERLSFERDFEAPVRAMNEEEESLERQCVMHDFNLSLFTFTVERMVAHHRRLERAAAERQAQQQSSSEALMRAQKLLMEGWTEGATVLEREEKATRRAIVSRVPASEAEANREYGARVQWEVEEAERQRVEAALQRERDLDNEVDDMYNAFEKRMKTLSTKFTSTSTSSTKTAAAGADGPSSLEHTSSSADTSSSSLHLPSHAPAADEQLAESLVI